MPGQNENTGKGFGSKEDQKQKDIGTKENKMNPGREDRQETDGDVQSDDETKRGGSQQNR